MPDRRFDHPSLSKKFKNYKSFGSKKDQPHQPKISILMNSEQHKALIEVPLDENFTD